jgi:hypothetical protein
LHEITGSIIRMFLASSGTGDKGADGGTHVAPDTRGAEGGRAPREVFSKLAADAREVVGVPAVGCESPFIWVCSRRVTQAASGACSAGRNNRDLPTSDQK